jgi:hypothetical protein
MINIKRYTIDYVKYATQRIPVKIRFADVKAYVLVIVGPIVYVYNQLILFRDLIKYKLTITPQVVYLEKMLNDRYDGTLRRIYIVDGKQYDPQYIYTKAELKPLPLYTKGEVAKPKIYLYTKGEGNIVTFDFVVMVPIALTYNSNEMLSLITNYKLASKLFTIQTF